MSDMVQIPGRDIVALLRQEAKRKPAIAQLMNDVQTMTDAEIDALKVPLPWYRKALKKVRDLNISAETTARVSDILKDRIVELKLNDVMTGTIRRWTYETRFIKMGRGGELEIKEGQYVWFPRSGGVWVGTLFSDVIDPHLSSTIYVKDGKRADYNEIEAERRQGKVIPGDNVQQIGAQQGALSSDDRGLFRIQRH